MLTLLICRAHSVPQVLVKKKEKYEFVPTELCKLNEYNPVCFPHMSLPQGFNLQENL